MMWLAGAGLLFSLEGGSAAGQLERFGVQADVQLIFDWDKLAPLATNPVDGEFASVQEALDVMLAWVPLSYEISTDSRNRTHVTVTVQPIERTPGAFTLDGYHYTCTPLAFFSGFYLTRIGNLMFRMGQLSDELQYCVRDVLVTDDDPFAREGPATDVTVRAALTPQWGPKR